jgi:hypothetical protein
VDKEAGEWNRPTIPPTSLRLRPPVPTTLKARTTKTRSHRSIAINTAAEGHNKRTPRLRNRHRQGRGHGRGGCTSSIIVVFETQDRTVTERSFMGLILGYLSG